MNKGEMKTLDLAKLEEIFHLLVDTTGNHSPPPLQPADRSVTSCVLIKLSSTTKAYPSLVPDLLINLLTPFKLTSIQRVQKTSRITEQKAWTGL